MNILVDTLSQIKLFISKLKEQYPSLYIDYTYDPEEDEYNIWHNDRDMEINDKHFKEYAACKAEQILFKNNIYNFYFGYDYYKTKQLANKEINSYTHEKQELKIEYIFKDLDNDLGYTDSLKTDTLLDMNFSSCSFYFSYCNYNSEHQYYLEEEKTFLERFELFNGTVFDSGFKEAS